MCAACLSVVAMLLYTHAFRCVLGVAEAFLGGKIARGTEGRNRS